MCRINIIHFSHHFSHHQDVFFRPDEAPNSSSSTSTTTCDYNNCHLSSPANGTTATRLNFPPDGTSRQTEEEVLTSLQRLPPYQFVPCPTHTNHHCVAYKQTMPCFLHRFQSAADAAAEVNSIGNGNTNSNAHSGGAEGDAGDGVNVAGTCPNLATTHEFHPLSFLLDNNHNENGDSMPGGTTTTTTTTTTLSQAKTAIVSTADAIHQQTVEMKNHILETCSLLETLYQELALHQEQQQQQQHQQHHHPAQQKQSRAFLMQLETPLQRASESCQQINQAHQKIRDLFRTFLQQRKDMADLLMAIEKESITNGGGYTYPISNAGQDLRELSVANIREVYEGPMRRGREVSGEVVRLLEGVSGFMLAVLGGYVRE